MRCLPVTDPGFELASERRVIFPVSLTSNQAVKDLLTMTPHLYRSSAEGRERAEAMSFLQLTADVWVRVFTLSA